MQNEIIISADPGETRVALLERSSFAELHIERDAGKSVVGSVVKGRVSRVLPGMQAAFVDIGLEKAAFLYVGDYFPNTFPSSPDANGEIAATPEEPRRTRGRRPHRAPPKIETVLSEGQEIVVQIAKAPIGTKGARITSHISIPGRHLVLTPWARRVGVSRRIDSDRERRRLREIIERQRPKDLGFIIRTAGDGLREADLEGDIRYLSSIWEKIQTGYREAPTPSVLYSEPGLALRMIRDFVSGDTKRIAVDSDEAFQSIKDFVDRFVADPKPKLEHYTGPTPIFDKYDLEAQIHTNLERKVWLKSGGSLIIEQSEALTAIDVNTGRYVGKRDLEETVFRTNLEAVKEVVYQLRFRNIGGLIIIDLIDMEALENREKVYRALQDALRADKARTNILKISELGLVEMTRKRTRANLVQTLCEPCSLCEGRGYVLSRESVAFKVLREIRTDLPRFCGRHIAITVNSQVAEELLTTSKTSLAALGEELGREIEVRARPGLHQEQFEITALDSGPPIDIPLRWLEEPKSEVQTREDGAKRPARGDSGSAGETPEADPAEQETAQAVDETGGEGEGKGESAQEETDAAASAPPQAASDAQTQPEEIANEGEAAAGIEPQASAETVEERPEPAVEATLEREATAGESAGREMDADEAAASETPVAGTSPDEPRDDRSEAARPPESPAPTPLTAEVGESSPEADLEPGETEAGPVGTSPPSGESEPGEPSASEETPLTLAERVLANATTLDDPPRRGPRRRGARRRSASAREDADGESNGGESDGNGGADGDDAAAPQALDAATESRILPASHRHEES